MFFFFNLEIKTDLNKNAKHWTDTAAELRENFIWNSGLEF